MRLRGGISVSVLAVAVVTCVGVAPACAQESGDIIVTAQKRDQRLQDVGIAISAVTGEQLSQQHILDASDIVSAAPGVESRRQFPQKGLRSNYYIRGVGSTDFNDATEAPVAVYVDDFYLVSPSTGDFSLMDIARAEILRGPQSTLFGRNSNGGAVQFITNKPSFDGVSGKIEQTAGSSQTLQTEGVLNVPIGDNFAVRLVGQVSHHDHYTKNVAFRGRDVGDQNYVAGRASLRYRNGPLDINYKYEIGRTRGDYGETDPFVTMNGPNGDILHKPDDINAYGFDSAAAGTNQPDRTAAEGYNHGYNRVTSHLFKVDLDLGASTHLTSITGYLKQKYDVYEDCDGTPSIVCNYDGRFNSEHYSQELRLNGQAGRLNWTLGGYYLHQKAKGAVLAPLYFTADGNPDPSGTTAGLGFYANDDLRLTAYSLFGQLEYAVTDQITLIGGLRWAHDAKHFQEVYNVYSIDTPNSILPFSRPEDFELSSHTVTGTVASLVFTDATAGQLTHNNKDSISGTAQINYKPNDNQLYYFSVRRGVKAPGFNNGAVPVFTMTPEQFPFKQETLMAYEIGEKISFLDNHIRLNSAAFYYDYSGMQIVSFKDLGQIQTNKDATIKGAEIELQVIPVKGLTLQSGVSFLDTKIKGVIRDASLPAFDAEAGEAPKFTANASVRYEWPIFGGNAFAQINGNYTGPRWTDALNFSAGRLKSLTTLDAQLGFMTGDDRVSVLFWGRNITNERAPLNVLLTLTSLNIAQQKWNEKRTYGMTLGYRF